MATELKLMNTQEYIKMEENKKQNREEIYYKKIADFAKNNNLLDFYTKKPIISYINRDAFMKLIQQSPKQKN